MASYFLLQKRPDGQTQWDDQEGRTYNFAERLPNAKNLVKNSVVLFYRPLKSGTPEDGCVFAHARVAAVEVVQGRSVNAYLTEYMQFQRPVPLHQVGDPRANPQHSFQPVDQSFYFEVLRLAGADEGGTQ